MKQHKSLTDKLEELLGHEVALNRRLLMLATRATQLEDRYKRLENQYEQLEKAYNAQTGKTHEGTPG